MPQLTKKTCIPFYNSAIGCHFYPMGNYLGTQWAVAAGCAITSNLFSILLK